MARALLDISDDLIALGELLLDADGDLSAGDGALEQFFTELGDERDEKIDNYCALICELQARAIARQVELDRLQARIDADEHTAKRLKDRLKYFFELQGIKKLETRRYAVAVQANGGLLPLEIEGAPELLPVDFQRVKIEADTKKIRDALAAGAAVPNCRLGERGTQLRIR